MVAGRSRGTPVRGAGGGAVDNSHGGAPAAHNAPVGEAMMVCRDEGLVELVQGAAAALRTPLLVTREADRVRAAWRGASTVFVGADSASWVAGLGLASRRGVHVVGRRTEEVLPWSVPLEAAVLVLPEQAGFLGAVLDQGASSGGVLVRLVGASGGLGTSTLAAGLAQVAARREPVALVDLARAGGGLDVLLGLEREPGWRWDDLAQASGHLGDLAPRLPQLGGVGVVSAGRGGREPTQEAATAVLRALTRTCPLVVVDAGRGEQAAAAHWAQTRTWLLVAADVRGVLAGRQVVQALGLHDVEVVVREGPGRRLGAGDVEESLGLPVVGRVGHHRGLAAAQAQGLPPAGATRRFARECARLLERVGS